jgi:hypothetical protein
LHDLLPPGLKFPGVEDEDLKSVLYGASESLLFPGLLWGGMTTDPAIFLQSALNITDVDEQSNGLWRIFSKLGAGYSTSRSRGEIISNAYACLPVLDETGSPIPLEGFEFTISARGSVPNDETLVKVEKIVYDAIVGAVGALISNKLPV